MSKSHEAALRRQKHTKHGATDLPVLVVIAHLMKLLFLLLVVLTLLRQTGAGLALVCLSAIGKRDGSTAHHVNLLKEPLQLRLRMCERKLHRLHRHCHCHRLLDRLRHEMLRNNLNLQALTQRENRRKGRGGLGEHTITAGFFGGFVFGAVICCGFVPVETGPPGPGPSKCMRYAGYDWPSRYTTCIEGAGTLSTVVSYRRHALPLLNGGLSIEGSPRVCSATHTFARNSKLPPSAWCSQL